MIQVVKRVARQPPWHRPIALRNQSYRRKPSTLYNPLGLNPIDIVPVLDSRYDASQTTQALFLQRENVPMVFAVAVSPTPGATGVNQAETVQVHMIKTFTDTESLKFKVNGLDATGTVSTAPGGIYFTMVAGAQDLVDSGDGLTHLYAEGTEDISGSVTVNWAVTPAPRAKILVYADGEIHISFPIQALADGEVPMPGPVLSLADGELTLQSITAVEGFGDGRLVVGDVFIKIDASLVANIAETFRTTDTSGTLEIHGYAAFSDGVLTFEISGPQVSVETSLVLEIATRQLFVDGSLVATISLANRNVDGSLVLNLIGTASSFPLGTLVVRANALPQDLYDELAAAGIIFDFGVTAGDGTAAGTSTVSGVSA